MRRKKPHHKHQQKSKNNQNSSQQKNHDSDDFSWKMMLPSSKDILFGMFLFYIITSLHNNSWNNQLIFAIAIIGGMAASKSMLYHREKKKFQKEIAKKAPQENTKQQKPRLHKYKPSETSTAKSSPRLDSTVIKTPQNQDSVQKQIQHLKIRLRKTKPLQKLQNLLALNKTMIHGGNYRASQQGIENIRQNIQRGTHTAESLELLENRINQIESFLLLVKSFTGQINKKKQLKINEKLVEIFKPEIDKIVMQEVKEDEENTATLIQAFYRGAQARKEIAKQNNAASIIQDRYRHYRNSRENIIKRIVSLSSQETKQKNLTENISNILAEFFKYNPLPLNIASLAQNDEIKTLCLKGSYLYQILTSSAKKTKDIDFEIIADLDPMLHKAEEKTEENGENMEENIYQYIAQKFHVEREYIEELLIYYSDNEEIKNINFTIKLPGKLPMDFVIRDPNHLNLPEKDWVSNYDSIRLYFKDNREDGINTEKPELATTTDILQYYGSTENVISSLLNRHKFDNPHNRKGVSKYQQQLNSEQKSPHPGSIL